MNPTRACLLAAVFAACATTLACAPASDASAHAPARKPDVPFDPSPPEAVSAMLRLARVGPGDVVFDLGCGDGRIVIAAVRDHGARGVCVDIDPQRIEESVSNARRAGVADRIDFRTEDLFQTDLDGATVVTLFLWPKVNTRLRPRLLRELPPGTRVVSYIHDMDDWRPDAEVTVETGRGERRVYLWRIPAPAAAKTVRD